MVYTVMLSLARQLPTTILAFVELSYVDEETTLLKSLRTIEFSLKDFFKGD